ncbi:MAG: cytochrome C, partial [Candidatus Binatota bacterium]
MPDGRIRSLLHHPLSLVGAGLVFFSLLSIAFLLAVGAILGKANPYIGIFIYIIYPGLLLFGVFLIPVGALVERWRRVKGGDLPPYPRIDLNNPKTRGILFLVVLSSLVLMGMISTISYQAYHFTESVTFCGELC